MQNLNKTQDPETQRNMIIAVVLAVIVMFLWEIFYNQPTREAQQVARQQAQQFQAQQELERLANQEFTQPAEAKKSAVQNENFAIEFDDSVGTAPIAAPSREEVLARNTRIKIDNQRLHGSIRLEGARFDDITLADYKQALGEDSPEVVLMNPSGTDKADFIELGWAAFDRNIITPNSGSKWQIEQGGELAVGNPLVMSWENGQGLTFKRKVTLDENYMFHVEDSVINNTEATVKLSPYGLISKSETAEDTGPLGISHIGPVGVLDEILQEVTYDELLSDGDVKFEQTSGWFGFADKYWLKSLLPANGEQFKVNFRSKLKGNQRKFQVDYLGQAREVPTGGTASYQTRIFAGAKELDLLEAYSEKYEIKMFDRAIDFGWFYFLTKPMTHVIQFFHEIAGNFGVAILMLTLVVKLCLFPIARKGYIAMGKIRNLQPKIKELSERYKEDKVKLQQEMLALYKKEKVNPASGCTPILLQIPVFFALYKVLYISIDMRHAPFFGWVKDLSAPDPTSVWNAFGMLPYDSPEFLAIGIWPFIMMGTMYLQQAAMPAPTDPTQAQIMKLLPAIFVLLFYSFPAGLVIYWSFSNSLTFLQQTYFTRRIPRD